MQVKSNDVEEVFSSLHYAMLQVYPSHLAGLDFRGVDTLSYLLLHTAKSNSRELRAAPESSLKRITVHGKSDAAMCLW